MKKGNIKKWIALGCAVLVIAAAYASFLYTGGVEADIVTAEKGTIRKVIKETGTVVSDAVITVSADFSGEIKGILVGEGDQVKEGDLLLTGDESAALLDLKSLQAQLSGLLVSHARAKETAARSKTLYEQGALSREEYDASLAAEKEMAAQVSSLRYSIESFAKTSGASGVTAPRGGTVTEVYVKEGEYTSVGAGLLEISNLDTLYIEAGLVSEDADLVREGNRVSVYGADAGGLPAMGSSVRRVHLKAREVMSGLGILQKRVMVEIATDPALKLRLGSDVDIEIVVAEKDNVLCVPKDAVFEMDHEQYVFVSEEGKARIRQVETGLEGDDFIEITFGLQEGDRVLSSPGNEIEDGVRLKQ